MRRLLEKVDVQLKYVDLISICLLIILVVR